MPIPIIGAATPEAVEAMERAQAQALENVFQGGCARAKAIMAAQQVQNHALFNVNSPETDVLLAGMSAAALYAAQTLLASVVQTFATRMKKLEDEKGVLEARVAELEAKAKVP